MLDVLDCDQLCLHGGLLTKYTAKCIQMVMKRFISGTNTNFTGLWSFYWEDFLPSLGTTGTLASTGR